MPTNVDKDQPLQISAVDAVEGRQSVRAFLDRPVGRSLIGKILQVAARAPSGSNTQPWHVYVVDGGTKKALSEELLAAHRDDMVFDEEYRYYPAEWREPYLARRRATGWGLYSALGISRGDKEAMKAQHGRNYLFFDAPTGLILTIDRDMEKGSWLDCGAFLEAILIAARGFGLETCPQQSFARFHPIIRQRLSIPPAQIVVCGVAIGYADWTNKANSFRTEREPIDRFVRFVDALD